MHSGLINRYAVQSPPRVGRAVAVLLKNKTEESPGSNGQGAR